ncbi:hypothetical protein [Blastochloris viridis]|uniref:Uncharacterized protein n=1 Tax=Blastochloris viridis TaxID=1079 RepID=A0A0H5BGP8_BLAVI|nr:hypothetical protein [Blastochloris viridis]ALK09779.1 hypothetical protein BVIR_2009 [Blastochloris viridis]BAS00320.1 hypothetical protein BV133_2726 [Blastochloris viridis]CUU42442.1 hypothetical protein BVIRIDIS_14540 [Blastochloris viridis]
MTSPRSWQHRIGLDAVARLGAVLCLVAGALILHGAAFPSIGGPLARIAVGGLAAGEPRSQPALPERDSARAATGEVRRALTRGDLADLFGDMPAALAFDSRPLPAFGPARTTTFQTLFAIVSAASATVFDARAPPAAG